MDDPTMTSPTPSATLPITYLFVPGNRPERFAKALAAGADRIIVDLEDAVAPQDKQGAREAVQAWMSAMDAAQRACVLVRINDALSPWYSDDLAMLPQARATAVMLPKCESAHQVAQVLAVLPAGGTVLPLIETAKGVQALAQITAAPGVDRLGFGSLDYMVDLDLPGEGLAVDFAAMQIAIASRAAGIASPVSGVTPALDAGRVATDMHRARALGFGAKMCIHPMQVQAVRTALAPSADDITWAQRVLAAWHDGNGSGAIQLDGKMVDKPVVLKAQRILSLANVL